jgi:hypothetical protein
MGTVVHPKFEPRVQFLQKKISCKIFNPIQRIQRFWITLPKNHFHRIFLTERFLTEHHLTERPFDRTPLDRMPFDR